VTVPAHSQHDTIHLLEHVPPHPVRKSDPHYHLFEEARRRIQAVGLWKCAVPSGPHSADLELHHSRVEYALQGGVDLNEINRAYGLNLADDEAFKVWIESEGNLECLCATHHRTTLGVHKLPEPDWLALRVWRSDLPPPAEVVTSPS
jgi:hypothetical protein